MSHEHSLIRQYLEKKFIYTVNINKFTAGLEVVTSLMSCDHSSGVDFYSNNTYAIDVRAVISLCHVMDVLSISLNL